MLSNLNKGRKSSEKFSFLKNVRILYKAREDVPNSFNSNSLLTKYLMSDTAPDTAPYATT